MYWWLAAGPPGSARRWGPPRAGAGTVLIETHAFFGGVAAWSLGMPINQMRPGREPRGIQPRELQVGNLQDALRADGVDLAKGGTEQKTVSHERGVS